MCAAIDLYLHRCAVRGSQAPAETLGEHLCRALCGRLARGLCDVDYLRRIAQLMVRSWLLHLGSELKGRASLNWWSPIFLPANFAHLQNLSFQAADILPQFMDRLDVASRIGARGQVVDVVAEPKGKGIDGVVEVWWEVFWNQMHSAKPQ